LVSPDGYVTEHGAQLPINEAGYVIHHTLHKLRPDVVAAAHCHSIYGKSWAAFGKPIDILQQDSCLFHDNLSVYANYGGIVLSDQEGKNIADALGPKHLTCIMQNHGLLTRQYHLFHRQTCILIRGD
jgi:ribulose-5-phosphate 4-epimerase/fuculose-1-phosphate aldolase